MLLAALQISGCGEARPERMPITGQVLIDDQPLTYGFVQVVPVGARPATGKIGPDGKFTLSSFEENDGSVFGSHPAAVFANEPIDATSQRWHAPKKYADIATSGLKVQVVEGQPEITLKLYWDKGDKPFVEKLAAE